MLRHLIEAAQNANVIEVAKYPSLTVVRRVRRVNPEAGSRRERHAPGAKESLRERGVGWSQPDWVASGDEPARVTVVLGLPIMCR